MPSQNNLISGVNLKGTAYPMQKRYVIVQSFIDTRSITQSARDSHVCYVTAVFLSMVFRTGNCNSRKGGNETGRKLEDWMLAYLEALVLTELWLYIREIRDRIINYLNLQVHQVPGIPAICTTLTLELGRKRFRE